MIELMTPSFGLIVLMIKYPVVDNQGHEETDLYTCESSYWFGNMIKFYIAFVCVYSLGINLVWSFLLNLSNKGADGVLPILKESFRMSIYTSRYNKMIVIPCGRAFVRLKTYPIKSVFFSYFIFLVCQSSTTVLLITTKLLSRMRTSLD